MRWVAVAFVFAYGVAHADNQLATDNVRGERASCPTRLIGHEPGVIDAIIKARKLRPITLERITLPADVAVAAVAPNLLVTVRIGDRDVRGIYSNIAGDGCIYADIRHAVDSAGNLYQIDGPSGVVDYTHGRCHTARGWQPCNLRGVTNVLYVVPDAKATLVGIIGSNLVWYPTTASRSRSELARPQ